MSLQFHTTHGDSVCKPYQFSQSVSCSILGATVYIFIQKYVKTIIFGTLHYKRVILTLHEPFQRSACGTSSPLLTSFITHHPSYIVTSSLHRSGCKMSYSMLQDLQYVNISLSWWLQDQLRARVRCKMSYSMLQDLQYVNISLS